MPSWRRGAVRWKCLRRASNRSTTRRTDLDRFLVPVVVVCKDCIHVSVPAGATGHVHDRDGTRARCAPARPVCLARQRCGGRVVAWGVPAGRCRGAVVAGSSCGRLPGAACGRLLCLGGGGAWSDGRATGRGADRRGGTCAPAADRVPADVGVPVRRSDVRDRHVAGGSGARRTGAHLRRGTHGGGPDPPASPPRGAGRLRGLEPVPARERGSAGPAARVRRTAGRVRSGRPRAGRGERLMTRPTRGDGPGRAYLDLQNRARREGRGAQELLTLYVSAAPRSTPTRWPATSPTTPTPWCRGSPRSPPFPAMTAWTSSPAAPPLPRSATTPCT